MNDNSTNLTEVSVDNILKWAYCPLLVWWDQNSTAREVADAERRKSGEKLLQQIVKTIQTYSPVIKKRANQATFTPGTALGYVWKSLIEKWGLGHLTEPLIDYRNRREALLAMYGPKGKRKKTDGSLYKAPSMTRSWKDDFASQGLLEIQRAIDSNQQRAGLAILNLPDDDSFSAPMGLSDVFAISHDIITNLAKDLPEASRVIAVGEPVFVDLLSIKLRIIADLIVDYGDAPRAAGRPKKDGEEEPQRKYLRYEMFSFDEVPPSIYDTARNLKLIAMRQSYPTGYQKNNAVLHSVYLRHLRSGQGQEFSPNEGDYADVLESLGRAYVNGNRAGIMIPRMVHSWRACQNCDYRALCFTDEGVMQAFNPPLAAQIQTSQEMFTQLSDMVKQNNGKDQVTVIAVLKSFAAWMARNPGATHEGVLWLLDSLNVELEQ